MKSHDLFPHQDFLAKLNRNIPIGEKLIFLHNKIKLQLDFIDRIAISLYDKNTDTLKTYTHSSGDKNPLSYYEARLHKASSLKQIIKQGRPRVVQDLDIFSNGKHPHTRSIAAHGYRASYTIPLYHNAAFTGFLFFNSLKANPFNEEILSNLDIYGHLIASVVINELATIRTLLATVRSARNMTHYRDFETGSHIERTAHYTRIIGKELAEQYQLNDEFIEHMYIFSPLHDIGKIGIPDQILLKPGKLDKDEFEIIKTHPSKGRKLIDEIMQDIGFDTFEHVQIMRNIAEYHHEAVDGSGYPSGLKSGQIPIEARISAVADVFDVLTSERPYKPAWSNQESFDMLRRMSGNKLDKDCVEALIKNEGKVIKIQKRFKDTAVNGH